jgi:hypothetical protein
LIHNIFCFIFQELKKLFSFYDFDDKFQEIQNLQKIQYDQIREPDQQRTLTESLITKNPSRKAENIQSLDQLRHSYGHIYLEVIIKINLLQDVKENQISFDILQFLILNYQFFEKIFSPVNLESSFKPYLEKSCHAILVRSIQYEIKK